MELILQVKKLFTAASLTKLENFITFLEGNGVLAILCATGLKKILLIVYNKKHTRLVCPATLLTNMTKRLGSKKVFTTRQLFKEFLQKFPKVSCCLHYWNSFVVCLTAMSSWIQTAKISSFANQLSRYRNTLFEKKVACKLSFTIKIFC